MGLLDFFKPKPPGECASCKTRTAEYRCAGCRTEYCQTCASRILEKLEEWHKGPHIKVSVTSGGSVVAGVGESVQARVMARMEAMRTAAQEGQVVCISCSAQRGRVVTFKKL